VARVVVKGRKESVLLYSLFDPPIESAVSNQWITALEHFKGRNFVVAANLFEETKNKELRLEKAALLYLEQIEELIKVSPDNDWDGAIEFNVK
jgi:hypothetical protein